MYTMKASVAVAKEADAKKGVSSTKSDNSIYRLRDEPERQLGSLRGVVGNIRRDGGTPSVESIAAELSGMSTGGRAPALLALQQTHGNRYVQRVVVGIQAKLKVGQPGDMYEQEADRVADDVVSQINAPHSQSVQRQDLPGAQEAQLQRKPFVQQVRRMSTHQHPTDGRMAVTPSLETAIQQARGRGQALPDMLRGRMEHVFEADFNGVGIHTDAESDRLNRSLQAQAFTASQDIFFRQGAYNPGSEQGQKLIAHELTHVVQQSGTSIQTQVIQLTPIDDLREALCAEPGEIRTMLNAIDSLEFADLPAARHLLYTMIWDPEDQMSIDLSTHDQADVISYFGARISSLEEEEAEWEELQEREAREFEEYIREEREYVPGEEPTMTELPPEQEMLEESVPVRPRRQPESPAVRRAGRAPPGQWQLAAGIMGTRPPPTEPAVGEEERRRAEQEERARLTTLLPAPSEARGQTTLPPPTEPAVGEEERRRAVETAVRRAGRTPPGQRQLAAQPPPVRGEVEPRLTVEVGRSRGVFNIFVEHTFVAQAFPPRGEAAAVGAESHWQPATNTLQICVTHTPGVRAYDTISPENRQWLEEVMSVHLDLIFEEVNQLPPPLMDATEEPSMGSWSRISEWLHTSLDLAGLIPGYGEVADAFNALFYIAEGRFGDAAISALAIIPFVGSVGTGGRVAVRGATAVRRVDEITELAQAMGRSPDEVTELVLRVERLTDAEQGQVSRWRSMIRRGEAIPDDELPEVQHILRREDEVVERVGRDIIATRLPGCRAGSLFCPINYLREEFEDLFQAHRTSDFASYVRELPEIDLRMGQSLRNDQTILTGNPMYAQYLDEVSESQWSEPFRRALAEARRPDVDYREFVSGGNRYRWPLSGDGRPWVVHHEPPLHWVTSESNQLWHPMPENLHEIAHEWWRQLTRDVRDRIPGNRRSEVFGPEASFDIREF